MRRFKLSYVWLIVMFAVLATGYVLWVHRTDARQSELDDRLCAFTAFTRETQKDVVLYLARQRQVISKYALAPEIRAFFEREQPTLAMLLARAEPPPCAEED